MASVDSEMLNSLREWAPLSDLFNKLPTKIQNGIFSQDVKLTCIDALPDFLVLGTNVGIVYWFDRKKKNLERLRCENSNTYLTSVKVTSTVDFMVACGSKDGNVSIFQIPKSHPDNLPDSLKPKHKQVERYTVCEMHKGSISALEWSKNGMKLFSGDKNGLVVLTEIDFYMHISKSMEVLNETYGVIQLSYYQQKLLISTTYRSIICQKLDKWKVTQVGKKDRKILGNFGGIFYQNGLRPSDVILYCARPGLRIWESDVQGIVQKTLLFRELLTSESPEIPLINPISNNMKSLRPFKEASFGKLAHFNEDLLVTFNNDVIYVLNPKELTILATISNLRNALDVATTKDEIFILEGSRSIIRISNYPETTEEISSCSSASSNFMQIPNTLKELSNILNTNSIISAIPPFVDNSLNNEFSVHTDETAITNAEEAVESEFSNRVLGDDNAKAKLEIYKKIGTEEFDDTILFKHSVRKKQNGMTASTTSLSSNSSDEKESKIVRPAIMNLSTVGLLPDLRSPDTILNDIKEKENMLADILNLDHVNLKEICQVKKLSEIKGNDRQNIIKVTTKKVDEDLKKEKIQKVISEDAQATPPTSNRNCTVEEKSVNIPHNVAVINNETPLKNTPVCLNIPLEWNLQTVQIKNEVVEQHETSFGDWEII